MAADSRIDEICKALAGEHRQLMSLIERLGDGSASARLPTRLERLYELLVVHFAHEQLEGGLYDTLGAQLSGEEEELGALKAEHRTILDAVKALREDVNEANAGSAPIRARVEELTALISRHEKREWEFTSRLLGS